MLEEQRAHRRYPILLTGSASSGDAHFEVVCTNIGPGGAFFASRVDPVAAAEVEVTLHLTGPTSPPVSLTGTVVYVTGRGNGRVGGFGVRWLRARCDFGPSPLRQLLSEVIHVSDLGDMTPDEAGTSRFEFGKVRRPPPPSWPSRRPSEGAIVAAVPPAAAEPTPPAEPLPAQADPPPQAPAASADPQEALGAAWANVFADFEDRVPPVADQVAAPPVEAAGPPAPAGRTSSIMRRLVANRASGPHFEAPATAQPAPAVAPAPLSSPPATRLSSVLRRVRAAQEARASQWLAAQSHPPAPEPDAAPAAQALVPPPAAPSRRSAAALVSAAVQAPQGTGPDGQNEHTVAYLRESPAVGAGRRPSAPTSWPAGIPASLADRYDQLQLIGQGGHGVVYRATDRHLNRAVVLKFLAQSSVATEIARKYFLREVKLAASLNHPNIVHIYDIAKVEDVLYYAMEFVDGVPLTAYLPAGTPMADDAFLFSVFTQICDALDHAHGQGVLHRDVKPENVLVAPDGMVKLFDFGLAWAQGEGFGEHSVLMGTPHYMAPEQLLGAEVDHRADIYALGVVLFRMLAGVLPFSEGNIFAAHAIEPVPDPRKWNPLVAPAAVAVVHRMMSKQPIQRPIDCRSAAVELYEALFVDRGGVV